LLEQRRDALGLRRHLAQRDRGIDELDGLGGIPRPGRRPRRAGEQGRAIHAREPPGVGDASPKCEGALVVLRGLGEGADALGLGARAHGGGQRTWLVAGTQPVVGDLGRDRRSVAAGEVGPRLQRGGEGGVHTRPLAGEELAVGGLAEERVAEAVAVAHRDEHVLAHGVAQRVRQVGLGQAGGGREQFVVHVAPAGSGNAYDALRARVERVDAGQQHVAQRRRQPLGALPDRSDKLLGEERVALGARENGVEQRLGRGFAEDSRQLFARLGA
jgi:hypothetical protein